MSFLDHFIGIVAPHNCVGCGSEGRLLCQGCETRLQPLPPYCYRCRQLSPGWRTCQTCQTVSQLEAVYVATRYAGSAKDLIWELKFQGAQAAAREMSRLMARLLQPKTDQSACLVSVPTATSRVRRRGYDQASILARELSRRRHMPCLEVLKRQGQAHQVGADRRQRMQQLQTAFRVSSSGAVRGRRLVLVDDVITTGATLEAAAIVLRAAGARRVEAITFAQPANNLGIRG